MGQVLVMAHVGSPVGASARQGRSPQVRSLTGPSLQVRSAQGPSPLNSSVLQLVPRAVPTKADRRRAAAQERAAAQARRVASASVEGSLADLELTRRGRWVLWTTAVAVATGMAVMGGGALASTPELPREVVPYTVGDGDNLWGLAEGIAQPGEDLRDVVELIIEVNGRASASLWAGEQILLPVRD